MRTLKRLLSAIPSIIGIVILTFVLTRLLPGDPAAYFAGPAATPESIEEVRTQLGLDKSLPAQFVDYISALAKLDLGRSLSSGQSVVDDLAARLPATLELTLGALIVATMLGISLGFGAALRPGGWPDRLCDAVTVLGQAMPTFFLGLLLVFVFYYLLGWAPAPMGRLEIFYSSPTEVTGFWTLDTLIEGNVDAFRGVLRQLVLPVVTLALFGLGPIARMTRTALLEVLRGDSVRTARAFGLSSRKVLWTYAFLPAAVPILNTVGMVLSFLLGANVLVEKVFGWPGVGAYAIESLLVSDFAPVQGFVLLMAVMYVAVNLGIDLLAAAIDPRTRVDG
ncbi:ABC transporter permease [Sinirhodobacter sp. WL0062]|uniref:ABC transporter permease n=1 Tax=Rhodobacter flavimaris TaxID=2907145 RepID=A0ABS8YX18_9RHOB|nr:ABC transporter permease [Sinirhodobacter sp. WL0062]MCE5973097.1 ABC transporter permease [Sinirhodobacter sp. WL0062]